MTGIQVFWLLMAFGTLIVFLHARLLTVLLIGLVTAGFSDFGIAAATLAFFGMLTIFGIPGLFLGIIRISMFFEKRPAR
jgi:hypothetical protein